MIDKIGWFVSFVRVGVVVTHSYYDPRSYSICIKRITLNLRWWPCIAVSRKRHNVIAEFIEQHIEPKYAKTPFAQTCKALKGQGDVDDLAAERAYWIAKGEEATKALCASVVEKRKAWCKGELK